jgi:hypothetical protein
MDMKTSLSLRILAVAAVVFGGLTLWSGGQALFGSELARASAGQVVAFVLWFNFLAGWGYLLAGFALWRGQRWAPHAASALAAATALVALGLGLHILSGGGYELRTVGAMALRLIFWLWVAWCANRARSAA